MSRGERKAKGARPDGEERSKPDDPFVDLVEEALKHFTDPQWLGDHSPLATPYFLGQRLDAHPRPDTPYGCGQILQQVLLEAANAIPKTKHAGNIAVVLPQLLHEPWGSPSHRFYFGRLKEHLETGSDLQRLLFWRYFRSAHSPSVEAVIAGAELNVERSHYYRLRNDAFQLLAVALLQLVHPALRLELPPAPVALVGRTHEQRVAATALRQHKTIAITGPAGFGKTALGAALAHEVAPQTTFWFTVRPGINDNLSALLYELAYFLAQHNSGSLWRLLIARKGAIEKNTLATLRFDLANLGDPVLLCFDEVDLLQPGVAHTPLLALLAELHGRAPLLLIGQQLTINVDAEHALNGLQLLDVRDLLARADVDLAPEHLASLHRHTQGNPHLLGLFLSLHRDGEPLESTLDSMGDTISLRSLFVRIEQRLSGVERQTLRMLAVHQDSAPEDIWDVAALAGLFNRRLAQRNGPGRVSLVPALRPLVYAQIKQPERRRLHRSAAAVRAARGEYTAAVYHYLKAGLAALALWTWHPHRDHEIQRGQAGTALPLLRQITDDQLTDADRRYRALDIGELELLIGALDQAKNVLQHITWPTNDVLSAQAQRTLGTISDLQSQLDQSRAAYHEGLRTVEQISREIAIFHKNLSWVAMRQRNLDEAWHEACLARYEAVNMQGYVQEERGSHAVAHTYYLEALAIAQQCKYPQGEAKTCNNLARLAGRRQRFDEAFTYAVQASRLFHQIGDLAMTASVQINLALAYNQAQRPADAISPAKEALAFFTQSDQAWGKAAAAQNLAEAHLALQQVEDAATYAQIVIDTNEQQTLPDGLRVLGEVELARGRSAPALLAICQSIRAARKSKDVFLEGYAWRALGRVLLVRDKPHTARAALDRAIVLFEQLGLPREVAATVAVWPIAGAKARAVSS